MRIAFMRSAFLTRWTTAVLLLLCSVYETVTKTRNPSPIFIALFVLVAPWIAEGMFTGKRKRKPGGKSFGFLLKENGYTPQKAFGYGAVLLLAWGMIYAWQYFRRRNIVQAFSDVIVMRGTEGYHAILPVCTLAISVLVFLTGFAVFAAKTDRDILEGKD